MIAVVASLVLAATPAEVVTAHRKVVADDGAVLALYRYSPGNDGRPEVPPVLMVVDLGFGRDLAAPLARFLAGRGRVVYVAELRGQGVASAGTSLRDLVLRDVPAVARVIGRPVDLIAHGYAGTLAMAAVGHGLEVRKIVGLSTPFAPEQPTELQAWFLSDGGRFSTLGASPQGAEIFSQLFVLGSRVHPGELRELQRTGTRDLGPNIGNELLTWLRVGDLPLGDGSSVIARLTELRAPTRVFLGLANAWAPSEACVLLREKTQAPVQLRSFSRFADGDDLAHVTLLMGLSATDFVFRDVEDFLR